MITVAEEKALRDVIGKSIDEIETPALVLDQDVFEANIVRMGRHLSNTGVGIRPHAKTHKTPEIALYQMKMGALGITCAKVGEAEAMADGGLKDILIANQVVGEKKISRAIELSKRIDLKVAVDCRENTLELSRLSAEKGGDLGVVVEVDIGNQRSGVRDIGAVVELARLISGLPGLTYRGIMGYEGHCVFIKDRPEREAAASKAYRFLLKARDALAKAGLKPEIVSCAGTGTLLQAIACPGVTDVEAGSYIFMDTRYKEIEGVDFEQSLTVLSTIVSRTEPDLRVCDAGLKSMSKEFGLVEILPSYGVKVHSMSEEHIRLVASADPVQVAAMWAALDRRYAQVVPHPLKLGDRVHLVPSHCCTTVNLHEVIYVARKGIVEDVWRVAARGRFV